MKFIKGGRPRFSNVHKHPPKTIELQESCIHSVFVFNQYRFELPSGGKGSTPEQFDTALLCRFRNHVTVIVPFKQEWIRHMMFGNEDWQRNIVFSRFVHLHHGYVTSS